MGHVYSSVPSIFLSAGDSFLEAIWIKKLVTFHICVNFPEALLVEVCFTAPNQQTSFRKRQHIQTKQPFDFRIISHCWT